MYNTCILFKKHMVLKSSNDSLNLYCLLLVTNFPFLNQQFVKFTNSTYMVVLDYLYFEKLL